MRAEQIRTVVTAKISDQYNYHPPPALLCPPHSRSPPAPQRLVEVRLGLRSAMYHSATSAALQLDPSATPKSRPQQQPVGPQRPLRGPEARCGGRSCIHPCSRRSHHYSRQQAEHAHAGHRTQQPPARPLAARAPPHEQTHPQTISSPIVPGATDTTAVQEFNKLPCTGKNICCFLRHQPRSGIRAGCCLRGSPGWIVKSTSPAAAEGGKKFKGVVIVIVNTGASQFVDLTNKHASATTLAGAYSNHPPACLPA